MVRTVLAYGHESWMSSTTSNNKFAAFKKKVLKRSSEIKWCFRVSNARLVEVAGLQPVVEYVKLSRWKWPNEVFR